jgi:hypothetical protein
MKKIYSISAIVLISAIFCGCRTFWCRKQKSGSNADDYFATEEGQNPFWQPLIQNLSLWQPILD